jgi:hypothetical protein
MKSSTPVPDILRSVRSVERFNVVTGPTVIIGIVAIFFPHHTAAWDMDSSKTRANQPACTACLIFASGGIWLKNGAEKAGLRWVYGTGAA